MIILHPRWQYVYWFVSFGICGFLIRVCHAVFQGTAATTVAVFLILWCVSVVAAYIDKSDKICWGDRSGWDIKRLPSGEWQCLQCDEKSIYLSNLANAVHEIAFICQDDDECSGCHQKVYQCHEDEGRVKHRQIKRSAPYPNGELYRVCTMDQEV